MEDLFSVASRTCRNAQPRADVRRNADPFLGRLLLGQSLTIPVYFLAYPDRTGTSIHALSLWSMMWTGAVRRPEETPSLVVLKGHLSRSGRWLSNLKNRGRVPGGREMCPNRSREGNRLLSCIPWWGYSAKTDILTFGSLELVQQPPRHDASSGDLRYLAEVLLRCQASCHCHTSSSILRCILVGDQELVILPTYPETNSMIVPA